MSTNVPLPVLGHIGVAIGNNILVWGGYVLMNNVQTEHFEHLHEVLLENIPYVNPAMVWIYNTESKQWRAVNTSGDIPFGTSGSGAVVIDNFLYVFGGYNLSANTSDLYRLNLRTMIWQFLDCPTCDQPSPRDKFMYWSYEERFYIFGGFGMPLHPYLDHNGKFVMDSDTMLRGWNNQVCAFDTVQKQWSNLKCTGNIPSPRAAGATARIDHRVFLYGGRHMTFRLNDLYVLDLDTLDWTRLHPHGVGPCGRSWHSLTPISESYIILFGGYSQEQIALNDVWLLDVRRLEWRPIQRQTAPPCRLWHSASIVNNNEIVIFGGCSNDINTEFAHCHNDIIVFQFSPHSLLSLCLEASHKYRQLLEGDFDTLPSVLQKRLQKRLPPPDSHNPGHMTGSSQPQNEDPGHARTCSIS